MHSVTFTDIVLFGGKREAKCFIIVNVYLILLEISHAQAQTAILHHVDNLKGAMLNGNRINASQDEERREVFERG